MKIYIDGENFRKGLERYLRDMKLLSSGETLKKYDIQALLGDVVGVDGLEIVYYSSKVKLPKGYEPSAKIVDTANKIKEESRVWLSNVVGQGIGLIKAGNLKIKQSKPCYKCQSQQEILQEKGVDVRLAVDMLEDVYENSPSVVGLLSSDTDLCPVIHKAVAKSVKVTYICFANGLTRAVAAASSETITISAEKIKKYFEGNKQ